MTAPKWVRAIMTVPTALVDAANDTARGLDFDEGAGTFSVPLAPEGVTEPTDYGCSTLLRPHVAAQVATELLPLFPGARLYLESEGWTMATALADAGLVVLPEES